MYRHGYSEKCLSPYKSLYTHNAENSSERLTWLWHAYQSYRCHLAWPAWCCHRMGSLYCHGTCTIQKTPVNRLTPRDTYLCNRCVYCYQRILPYLLKDDTYWCLLLLEIPSLLPKIPLLPHLAYFGQLYFSLTKHIQALIGQQLTWLGHAHQSLTWLHLAWPAWCYHRMESF